MDNRVGEIIKKEEVGYLNYMQGVIPKQLDEIENSMKKAKKGILE